MFKVNGHRRSVGRLREDKDPTFFCNTPRLLNYSQLMSRSKEPSVGRPATLTKRGRSLISRANCPRWSGSSRAASFWAGNGLLGLPTSADIPH